MFFLFIISKVQASSHTSESWIWPTSLKSPLILLKYKFCLQLVVSREACSGTFFCRAFEHFSGLAVPSRIAGARSSKSIGSPQGQVTTRLVWRPTSFHNMWPGLLNRKLVLGEKIFPCSKSDLAACVQEALKRGVCAPDKRRWRLGRGKHYVYGKTVHRYWSLFFISIYLQECDAAKL